MFTNTQWLSFFWLNFGYTPAAATSVRAATSLQGTCHDTSTIATHSSSLLNDFFAGHFRQRGECSLLTIFALLPVDQLPLELSATTAALPILHAFIQHAIDRATGDGRWIKPAPKFHDSARTTKVSPNRSSTPVSRQHPLGSIVLCR